MKIYALATNKRRLATAAIFCLLLAVVITGLNELRSFSQSDGKKNMEPPQNGADVLRGDGARTAFVRALLAEGEKAVVTGRLRDVSTIAAATKFFGADAAAIDLKERSKENGEN